MIELAREPCPDAFPGESMLVAASKDIRVNFTPSMPLGPYVKTHERPHRGAVVSVPAALFWGRELAERLLAQTGGGADVTSGDVVRALGCNVDTTSALKRIRAVGGDVVKADGEVISVNGVVIARRFPAAEANALAGFELPYWSGERKLARSEVLLLGDGVDGWEVRQSLDGRYLGPTRRRDIVAVWRPVLPEEWEEFRACFEAERRRRTLTVNLALGFDRGAYATARAAVDPLPLLSLDRR